VIRNCWPGDPVSITNLGSNHLPPDPLVLFGFSVLRGLPAAGFTFVFNAMGLSWDCNFYAIKRPEYWQRK
jgi:hypothetical protein